jgi:hypothetical protein
MYSPCFQIFFLQAKKVKAGIVGGLRFEVEGKSKKYRISYNECRREISHRGTEGKERSASSYSQQKIETTPNRSFSELGT